MSGTERGDCVGGDAEPEAVRETRPASASDVITALIAGFAVSFSR